MGKVYFIFGVHNHQPVGNFDHVFKYAYDRTYYPFLKIIEKFPKIKFCLHNSGPLCDWIMDNEPEYVEIVKKLVERGQVEIISGGYYEPILPLISDKDKNAQISKMNDFIKTQFDSVPKGIWIAERVWEQYLAGVINRNNLEYTFLDDAHFRFAGYSEDEFFNYYLTEDAGSAVKIFPISKTLRYKIPFAKAYESIEILKSFKRPDQDILVTLFDDGEKFGLWPNTYEWVYEKKWLEDFLKRLSDCSDIETILPKDAKDKFKSEGIIYFQSSSYQEMTEWVLEPGVFKQYIDTKNFLMSHGMGYQAENLVKGGVFRNFYRKYKRLNYMHKRMLDLSKELAEKCDPVRDKNILDFCYKAQTNCGYWHGVFGGFYLSHIRSAVYENLIKAENLFDEKYKKTESVDIKDIDLDGLDEVIVKNNAMRVCTSARGGTILELSLRHPEMNLVNTITRQRESYHDKIKDDVSSHDEHASIHDIVIQKEKGLDKYLIYDNHERVCAVDNFLKKDLDVQMYNRQDGVYPLSNYIYDFSVNKGKGKTEIEYALKDSFDKKITICKNKGVTLDYVFKKIDVFERENFGVEFNLSFLSLKDVFYCKADSRTVLEKPMFLKDIDNVHLEDLHAGLICRFDFSGGDVIMMPVYTVTSSESGFERSYQQVAVMFVKKDSNAHFNINLNISQR
ncbi:MAG: DUF1926 domain-containing protein [Candidatus Omnitrophica bacterium]|nr:DUF1926 domain-containing protein [Candidatus Omnitrophota bacterium]